jgi:hypothetical protein
MAVNSRPFADRMSSSCQLRGVTRRQELRRTDRHVVARGLLRRIGHFDDGRQGYRFDFARTTTNVAAAVASFTAFITGTEWNTDD